MLSELAVKIMVNGTKPTRGSGCLFQPNSISYTYVLTAKHCLIGIDGSNSFDKTNILIQRDNEYDSSYLIVLDYYLHPESGIDIAIIKVEYIEGLSPLLICEPIRNNDIAVYGYPNILSDREINGQSLEGKVVQVRRDEKRRIVVKVDRNLFTLEQEARTNMEGFSGSGIYHEINNGLSLIGIVIELKHPTGAFSELIVENIFKYNDFLLELGLELLDPKCICSFDDYLTNSFPGFDGILKVVFQRKFREAVENTISPKKLIGSLKERLLIPYSTNINADRIVLESKMWSGWIVLIISLAIDSKFSLMEKDLELPVFLYRKSKQQKKEPVHFFYVNEFYNFHDCIKYIITNDRVYSDIEQNGIIIINNRTGDDFKGKALTKSKINKILIDISRSEPIVGGINIDDPQSNKNIGVLHLKAFKEQLDEVDNEMDIMSIEESLRLGIERIFEDARKE